MVGAPDLAAIRASLAAVPDPEIPVISVLDLGIVRELHWEGEREGRTLHVAITPTYSGCPAMRAIERDIVAYLHASGIERVVVDVRLAPAWSTDWLNAEGREKLRAYGISPPRARSLDPHAPLDLITFVEERVACPRCGSDEAELLSAFGSTPCKALYRCRRCREPFDHFKQH